MKRLVGLWTIAGIVMLLASNFVPNDALAQDGDWAIADLSWSPNGNMIAGAGKDILRVWNATTGATFVDLQGIESGHVTLSISWSPDGLKLVTAIDDGLVRVWNVADPNFAAGQLLGTIAPTQQNGFLRAVAWSPDGQQIATGTTSEGYTLQIWNSNDYSLLAQFSPGWVTDFSWYQNSSISSIAIVDENQLPHIQVISSTPQLPTVVGDKVAASSIAWDSSGGKIAVGYNDGVIKVWDTITNSQVASMTGAPVIFVDGIAWSPDNKFIASASGESAIRIWDSATGQMLHSIPTNRTVYDVDFSPDGTRLAYGGDDGTVQIIPASQLPTATPSATIQSDAQTLRDLLSDPACQRTCFMGIEPGLTTQTELENLLNQHHLEFTQSAIASGHLIIYTIFPPSNPFLSSDKPIYIDVTADRVDLLTLFPQNVTTEQLTSAFGAPDAITGSIEIGNNVLYVDEGLIFLFATDSDTSGLLFITPPGRTTRRMSMYLENSLPCTGTADVCNIATATASPQLTESNP